MTKPSGSRFHEGQVVWSTRWLVYMRLTEIGVITPTKGRIWWGVIERMKVTDPVYKASRVRVLESELLPLTETERRV